MLLKKIKKPDDEIVYRDLNDEMIFISNLTESGMKIPEAEQSNQHKKMFELSDKLVLELKESDLIIISVPIYNFGPPAYQNYSVRSLIEEMSKFWVNVKWTDDSKINMNLHEAALLKLNCDKALGHLSWQATLDYKDTIRFTSEWYYDFYKKDISIFDKTLEQISEYENMAKQKELHWTE